jgi:selenocysteine-specific elongation factor
LTNRKRVRFHHAAGEILARVILLDSEKLVDGESGFIQLRLERPTAARRGDRFVLRSYSPMRVIAGGRILDPSAAKAKRFRKKTLDELRAFDTGGPRDIALTCAGRRPVEGIAPDALRRFGLTAAEATAVCGELEDEGLLVSVGGRFFAADVCEDAERTLAATMKRLASKDRLRWGVDREELREKMGLGGGPLFDFLMERGKRSGRLFFKGGQVRAGSGERELTDADRTVLSKLEGRIRDGGFAFVGVADLRDLIGDDRKLLMYLRILEEDGAIVKVAPEAYLHGESRRALVRMIAERVADGGAVSVGDFKEMCGFSRKYAVPLLEYLDSEGFTVRSGDVRTAGPRIEEERNE